MVYYSAVVFAKPSVACTKTESLMEDSGVPSGCNDPAPVAEVDGGTGPVCNNPAPGESD